MKENLPQPVSATHQHILTVVNTILPRETRSTAVSLCDIGCGDGQLLAYLARCLPVLRPDLSFVFYGIDVADVGIQPAGYFARTLHTLQEASPGVDWEKRLHLITTHDPWPFHDNSLDIITSNQVLEHVADHRAFFSETYRTLVTGGRGVHLFPLKHYIWEGHLHIPLVHRIYTHDSLRWYIRLCNRLGLGGYRTHRDQMGMSMDHYVEEHADYMAFMTNYLGAREALKIAKMARLRASFAFTGGYYATKLRSLLHRPRRYRYRTRAAPLTWFGFQFFKRIASVTLTLEKQQIYQR